MDISVFTRDPDRLYKALAKTDEKLLAKEPIRIYIPVRFAEKSLAYIGSETYIVGIFMIATEDNRYAVSTINAMMPIEPTNTSVVKMDDVDYYEFYFRKGSTIISNLKLVKDNKLIYSIFDEIYTKGKAPWYINYLDFSKLLSTAKKHAGVNIGNHEVMEVLASMLARIPEDKTKYYRQYAKTKEDIFNKQPAIIPLRSVQYSATNTTNKLAGSYFRPALVSALVTQSDRVERVESLLTQ